MNILNDNCVMVIDTEYDTNPKRLLSLAYIIYNKGSKTKKVLYVKHDPNIFKVNEYGESFKYHKLTNKYLFENGKSLESLHIYILLSMFSCLKGNPETWE